MQTGGNRRSEIGAASGGCGDDRRRMLGAVAVWLARAGVAKAVVSVGFNTVDARHLQLFVSCVPVGAGAVHVHRWDGVPNGHRPKSLSEFVDGFDCWYGDTLFARSRTRLLLVPQQCDVS